MKISTKGRYGLRTLLDLAIQTETGSVTLAQIAERQQVSVGYLEQIFTLLRKAGLVTGRKGPQGGYSLAVSPERISIRDVLASLESDLFSVPDDPVDALPAVRTSGVVTACVWEPLAVALEEALSGMSLADLMEAYRHMGGDDDVMYFI